MTDRADRVASGEEGVTVAQGHMLSLLVHKGLLALHRPFFGQALMAERQEPMVTAHAASFNACVASARKHTQIMRSVLRQAPVAANKWWFFLCRFKLIQLVRGEVRS